MAGRFVFQKLASGTTRPTSRLAAQASASSRATAPVIMPRASEDGIRTLSRFFHAAAVHPGNHVVPSITNHGSIRGYSRVPAKIRRLKARMSSPSINNHKKPSSALVDSVGEVKPICSPDAASNQLKLVDGPARLVDWASKKYKGLHRHDMFLLKFFVWANIMAVSLVVVACSEDVNVSSMVPSQSLHCSGCNCRK